MKRTVFSFASGATVATLLLILLLAVLQQPHQPHQQHHDNLQLTNKSTDDEVIPSLHQDSDACACANADGILFISRVIRKAGAGTMFFQSIVDSLLYAEKYNLVPYIWINDDENQPCYDPKEHGVGPNRTVRKLAVGRITNLIGEGDMECDTEEGTRPGPPSYSKLKPQTFNLVGNGLWQSYFQPIPKLSSLSSLQHGVFPLFHHNEEYHNSSCAATCSQKPVFEMTRSQVMPDMHRCSEFAVRGWAFRGIPNALLPKKKKTKKDNHHDANDEQRQQPPPPLDASSAVADWLWEHRQRAAPIVKRYFHLQPWLQERVEMANPTRTLLHLDSNHQNDNHVNSGHSSSLTSRPRRRRGCCLAAHIRLTDKASGRDKKGLQAYRPYMEAFAEATTSTWSKDGEHDVPPLIYIATDDASVLPMIQTKWSKAVSDRIRFQQDTFRSQEEDLPTFKLLAHDKHRSNTEALVDMYAMSKCCYFVHG